MLDPSRTNGLSWTESQLQVTLEMLKTSKSSNMCPETYSNSIQLQTSRVQKWEPSQSTVATLLNMMPRVLKSRQSIYINCIQLQLSGIFLKETLS